jgi:hypothetical protein
MTISARLTECPTRNVFEARGVFKASSDLFNLAMQASLDCNGKANS